MNAMVKRTDVALDGVYDADATLRAAFAERYGIEPGKMFDDV